MIMFARYGHTVFPAIQSLDNFYYRQRDDGLIWRVFREDNGEEHWWGNFPNTINPPLFSWAEVESFRLTGDDSRFEPVRPTLENMRTGWKLAGERRAQRTTYIGTPGKAPEWTTRPVSDPAGSILRSA